MMGMVPDSPLFRHGRKHAVLHSPSIEFLAGKIDSFNERYAVVENEKAVFSIEYAEFHWNEARGAGCLLGNRYGIVRVARDLVLTAASREGNAHEYASRFEEGSDDIVILRRRPDAGTDARAVHMRWDEARAFAGGEALCLENILDAINSAVGSLCAGENEPAKIEWDLHNRAAFITGTAFGLVLLARDLVQFALSASIDDTYETGPLHPDGGRLILVLRDNC